MNRPWQTWVAFALCLAVVLCAMGWISAKVLSLEGVEEHARQQGEREENVRLALWRMDSALAPMIAQESARPYFAYQPFFPAERAYTRMFNEISHGEVLVPSPLLTEAPVFTLLHFQFNPSGEISSPQVPSGNKRELAESVATTPQRIAESTDRLNRFRAFTSGCNLLQRLPDPVENPSTQTWNCMTAVAFVDPKVQVKSSKVITKPARENWSMPEAQSEAWQAQQAQDAKSIVEFQKRSMNQIETNNQYSNRAGGNRANADRQRPQAQGITPQSQSVDLQFQYNDQQSQNDAPQSQGNAPRQQRLTPQGALPQIAMPPNALDSYQPSKVSEGVLRPLWIGTELVLVRRVNIDGRDYVQGCWLDWPAMSQWLRTSIEDLVPHATLAIASPNEEPSDRATSLLAALPVRLDPGELPEILAPALSPIRISLFIAWGCVLLAALAVGTLLLGALSLSERRGAFVSAVTHELRTPLTTFRMYTEMLAAGMVPDEAKRKRYLDTLRAEAERLTHLVENVLAYAKLERGRAARRVETVALPELVEKTRERLAQRAEQTGMKLESANGSESAAGSMIRTDLGAVEQILFNLVDNACKYAASGTDKSIAIHTERDGRFGVIRVRDKGPGFTKKELRSLFRPFSKSAREAAHSAPGVGLGLALSRRLARDLGGDLRLDPRVTDGACFELRLPLLNA